MSGGGGTNTTTQVSQPPPQFLNAYQNVVNQAQNVASAPFQTPQAPVAPLNGYQGVAAQDTFNAQGAAQPYLDQAGQLINQSQTPIAPTYTPFATGALDSAYAGAATPILNTYQPFANQATAGYAAGASTPLESNYQPFAEQATQGYGIGAATPLESNYQPFGQAATQGYQAGQAANLLGQSQELSNPAANLYGGTAGGLSQGAINQYENPYTQQVVGATQAEFANQNAQQNQGIIGNAISSGAWGGDRASVAQGIAAGQEQLAQAPVIAGLESQGYTQGVQTAEQQQQTQQAAAAGLTGIAGLQTSALGQQAANQFTGASGIAGIGAEQGALGEQQAQNQFAAAQGIGVIGAEQGALGEQQAQNQFTAAAGNAAIGGQEMTAAEQQAANQFQYAGMQQNVGNTMVGAQEAQNWLASQGAYSAQNLGNEALNTQLTGANALMGAGDVLQTQQQAEMNAPYEQQLAALAYPFQTTQYLGNITEGIGGAAGGTSSTTSPGPSAISQAAGLGTTALGIAGLVGLLNRGGAIRRAGGGIIPGMPGGSLPGLVSVVPDAGAPMSLGGVGGPPRPPQATQTPTGTQTLNNELSSAIGAIKMGQQANTGVSKLFGGAGASSTTGANSPWDTSTLDMAANSAADTGITQDLGLFGAARGGGISRAYGGGNFIRPPHMPHPPSTGMGIAGAHAFHPPGLPKLAPGGGINVDPYPDQTAAEVNAQNMAQDSSNAMMLAMAANPQQQVMPMMSARGGGISGYAGGGGVSESDSDSFDVPVSVTGAGSGEAMPEPPIPPAGGPPSQQQGGIGPAVQSNVTPSKSGGIGGKDEEEAGGGGMTNKQIWMSVLGAGLGMMGGTSPFAGVNIGRGGLEGLQMGQQMANRQEQMELRKAQQQDTAAYKTIMGQVAQQRANTGESAVQLRHDDRQDALAQGMTIAQMRMAEAAARAASAAGKDHYTVAGTDPDDGSLILLSGNTGSLVKTGTKVGMKPGEQSRADLGQQRLDQSGDLAQQRIDNLEAQRSWDRKYKQAGQDEKASMDSFAQSNDITKNNITIYNAQRDLMNKPQITPEQANQTRQQLSPGAAPGAPPKINPVNAASSGLLPMPGSQKELVPGKGYSTGRGPATWDGSQFIPIQQ